MASNSDDNKINKDFASAAGYMEALLLRLEKSKNESLRLADNSEVAGSTQLAIARRDDAVVIQDCRQIVLIMQKQHDLIVQQQGTISHLEKRLAAVEAEFAPKRALLDKPLSPPKGPAS